MPTCHTVYQISNWYSKIQSCLLLLELVNLIFMEFIAFVVHSQCWYPWIFFVVVVFFCAFCSK